MDSIDTNCANEISLLLQPLSPLQLQEYFDDLIAARQCPGIKVKLNGEFGKGVYAESDFREEELVLKDQMLVGIQHPSNKIDCLVCSFCFQFIGSIELQIGRKLYLQNQEVSTSNGSNTDSIPDVSKDCYPSNYSIDQDISCSKYHEILEDCAFSNSNTTPLPNGVAESLVNGKLVLPYSDKFLLPSAITCSGGCGEAYYCSKSCAEADWESSHSLLCTGRMSESASRDALTKFIQHANETNDIFLLVAKAISFTILRYRKLKANNLKELEKSNMQNGLRTPDISLLLEAWKPMSIGYKRRWWDCIALPDDVDPSDETIFRMQIRDLAFASLQLLKAAIFDKECEPLFSLEIYGHVIGMFELNNLDLVVASPVEDYFLYIDDLECSKKKEAEKITRQFLDALGDDYSICCQGTAFFPLQSCMNHSCCPNAKAFKREEDRDGQASIIALTPICKGEEVRISYIDEELSFEERQASLADYGFKCSCDKCSRKKHYVDCC